MNIRKTYNIHIKTIRKQELHKNKSFKSKILSVLSINSLEQYLTFLKECSITSFLKRKKKYKSNLLFIDKISHLKMEALKY